MSALVAQRFDVYAPVFGNGIVDLIAVRYGFHPIRIEVKTTTLKAGPSWVVNLARRPNTVDGKTSFRGSLSDVLAVHVPHDGYTLFLPSAPLDGRVKLSVQDDHELHEIHEGMLKPL